MRLGVPVHRVLDQQHTACPGSFSESDNSSGNIPESIQDMFPSDLYSNYQNAIMSVLSPDIPSSRGLM